VKRAPLGLAIAAISSRTGSIAAIGVGQRHRADRGGRLQARRHPGLGPGHGHQRAGVVVDGTIRDQVAQIRGQRRRVGVEVRPTIRPVEQPDALDRGLGGEVLIDLAAQARGQQQAGDRRDQQQGRDRQHRAEQHQATPHRHRATRR
jgi:hypothetical protein